MDTMNVQQSLSAILHQGSQLLLVPVIVFLIVLVLTSVVIVGAIIVEYFTERRHFKVNHKKVIADLHDAAYDKMGQVIDQADLLRSQQDSLRVLVANMGLPDDELFAMAQVELERADARYQRRVNLTDTVSKIAPMCGLMGTLIPLGPGIVAMGQGDVSQLSSSLLVAFDTTVAGLISAVVALIVSRIHKTWYAQYHTAVQALMSCILEEAAEARENGVQLPYGEDGDKMVPGRERAPKRSKAPDGKGTPASEASGGAFGAKAEGKAAR